VGTELLDPLPHLGLGNAEALPDLHRSCAMAKTDNRDKHASPSSVQQQLLKTETMNKSKLT
jgi:hypothetical protein